MNIFRFLGDMSHLLSFFLLLFRLQRTKTATGISLKTQELYLLVFLARYLDLFTVYISLYNTCMKIFYIVASGYIVFLLRFVRPYKSTYDRDQDSFLYGRFAILPCLVLGFFVQEGWGTSSWWTFFTEWMWAFSIYLEAIAIFPQLIVLQRHKDTENLTIHYMGSLGAYRALYILNWIYRYFSEGFFDAIAVIAGVVQTALYSDFFLQYYRSILPELPSVASVSASVGGGSGGGGGGGAGASRGNFSLAKAFKSGGGD